MFVFFGVFSFPYSYLTNFMDLIGDGSTFFWRGTFHWQGFEVQGVWGLSGRLSLSLDDEKLSSANKLAVT